MLFQNKLILFQILIISEFYNVLKTGVHTVKLRNTALNIKNVTLLPTFNCHLNPRLSGGKTIPYIHCKQR